MEPTFSYRWYIIQFNEAKDTAEKFILSVDETIFSQPPSEGRWSIAECYSHLINYGHLYFDNLSATMNNTQETTNNLQQSFQPRWLARKLVSFFEPPYKIKMKTVNSMRPDPVSEYDRIELLDKYVNLQEQFIAQLEKGQQRSVDLSAAKMNHPFIPFMRMTLTECFALAEAHQRRHQWQAEQTLKGLQNQGNHL